ncbi:hypothetical protein Anapl_13676 [Anas platyrhynchos]|uniref:Uncharacterized protein n=1 Tax=Anas platyrhynchos TaxID=8839 RepID=R0KZG6_ANAPL|nr:hypothetical protein Anapl_13676 [Anas platyrhynchos]
MQHAQEDPTAPGEEDDAFGEAAKQHARHSAPQVQLPLKQSGLKAPAYLNPLSKISLLLSDRHNTGQGFSPPQLLDCSLLGARAAVYTCFEHC